MSSDSSNKDVPLILVTGWGSQQALGFVRYLESSNFPCRLRLAARPESKHVSEKYEIVTLDDNDEENIRKSVDGVFAIFMITFTDFDNPSQELVSATRVARIAHEKKVSTIIFSGGERTGFPLLDVKAEIESEILKMNFKQLIVVKASYFYENIVGMLRPLGNGYALNVPISLDSSFNMVASVDIGLRAANVFTIHDGEKNCPAFVSYDAAGEFLDFDEVALAFKEILGKDISVNFVPRERFVSAISGQIKKELLLQMFQWLDSGEHKSKIEANAKDLGVRKRVPLHRLRTFRQWLIEMGSEMIIKKFPSSSQNPTAHPM